MSDLEPEKQKRKISAMRAMNLAFEFGFIFALPVVALGFLGKWLDHTYHTKYFILIGIGLALVSSTVWMYKKIKDITNNFHL